MKKTLLTSILAITFAIPAFATIESGSTCDTTNLGQSENNSTANVEADWTANTININWYIDDSAQTTLTTNTCTYDGTITLPTQPTKTGYTFAGWQLRAAAQAKTLVDNCADIHNMQDCGNSYEVIECRGTEETFDCMPGVSLCIRAPSGHNGTPFDACNGSGGAGAD